MKGHVVIAGLVNNDFEPLENLRTDRQMGWGPRAERAGVGRPLAVGGWDVISMFNFKIKRWWMLI